MTTITFKINERTKAGKAFMQMKDTFFANAVGIEIEQNKPIKENQELTPKQQKWVNRLKKVAADVKAGTFKGNSLEGLMNEL